MDIRPEILDELLASTDDPNEIFGADGLLASLTARLVERVTEAELDHHLRAEAEPTVVTASLSRGRHGTRYAYDHCHKCGAFRTRAEEVQGPCPRS